MGGEGGQTLSPWDEEIVKLRGQLFIPVQLWDIAGYTAGAAVEFIQV